MQYEINFLVLQSKTEDLEKIQGKVKKVIESNKGKIVDELFYKKRKLAYEIAHEHYGFFNVFRFELKDAGVVNQLKNDLNLEQGVNRYIIVRADELPKLQKKIGGDALDASVDKRVVEKIATETEGTEAKKVDKVVPEKRVEKTAPVSEKVVEDKKEKEVKEKKDADTIKKEDIQKEVAASEEKTAKAKKDDKSSLDDLDEKLNEILNS